MVDTDVAIDALRGVPAAGDVLRASVRGHELLVASEITRFELLAGLREGEEQATERFLGELAWLPVTEGIARRAAGLARAFRPAFGGIEDEDYLVAATALECSATLLTRNVRHYPMLPGLRPAY